MLHGLSSGNFFVSHRLESKSENTLLGGPFGKLDDHYNMITKRNGTRVRAK